VGTLPWYGLGIFKESGCSLNVARELLAIREREKQIIAEPPVHALLS
jgi:hypothetical protein